LRTRDVGAEYDGGCHCHEMQSCLRFVHLCHGRSPLLSPRAGNARPGALFPRRRPIPQMTNKRGPAERVEGDKR